MGRNGWKTLKEFLGEELMRIIAYSVSFYEFFHRGFKEILAIEINN